MNNNYDYTKPLNGIDPRIIERNRKLIQSEAKYTPHVDADILNSMPIPTNPISQQEARNMAYNAFRIQCERNCTPGYKSSVNNKCNSNSDNYTGGGCFGNKLDDHPNLVLFVACVLALLPLEYYVVRTIIEKIF